LRRRLWRTRSEISPKPFAERNLVIVFPAGEDGLTSRRLPPLTVTDDELNGAFGRLRRQPA